MEGEVVSGTSAHSHSCWRAVGLSSGLYPGLPVADRVAAALLGAAWSSAVAARDAGKYQVFLRTLTRATVRAIVTAAGRMYLYLYCAACVVLIDHGLWKGLFLPLPVPRPRGQD